MILLAGWGKDLKKISDGGLSYCEHCKNTTVFDLMELNKRISLFFVPVAKWNNKYYLVCSTCEAVYELDEANKSKCLDLSFKLPSNLEISLIWKDIDSMAVDFMKSGKSLENLGDHVLKELSETYKEDDINYVFFHYLNNLAKVASGEKEK